MVTSSNHLDGTGVERRLPDECRSLDLFIVGAAFLWGGLALSIANYVRAGRRS